MIAAFGTIADVVALLSASSGFDRFDFRNFFCSRGARHLSQQQSARAVPASVTSGFTFALPSLIRVGFEYPGGNPASSKFLSNFALKINNRFSSN